MRYFLVFAALLLAVFPVPNMAAIQPVVTGCSSANNVRVDPAPPGTVAYDPSIVWADGAFGVAFLSNRTGGREVFFARLDASGQLLGPVVQVTHSQGSFGKPSLVWTGTDFGIAYLTSDRVRLAILSDSGEVLHSGLPLSDDLTSVQKDWPSLVWTGSEFGAVWSDDRTSVSAVYFARSDRDGNKIGQDVQVVSSQPSLIYPRLVWNGSVYAVTWNDHRTGRFEVFIGQFSLTGDRLGSDIQVSSDLANSYWPSPVWSGSEYGIAWYGYSLGPQSSPDIYFARLDAMGNRIGQKSNLSNNPYSQFEPSLVWAGHEYSVAWSDFRDGQYEIYVTRIDPGGGTNPAYRVSDTPSTSRMAALAWGGRKYALAWSDQRNNNDEIYFSAVGCRGPRRSRINLGSDQLRTLSGY